MPTHFFETVSGFTTTGASILTDVEAMSHGLLFWRSFTHWVGGMGVLVFITMLSGSTDRSMNILKAEMPGPVKGKLTPPDPGHRPGAVSAVFSYHGGAGGHAAAGGYAPV
ncbi:MAG: potassium transporter TrkG [Oscillospiraceae bacterium]